MAEKNSLWKNIRKKAEQNRRTGAKPKKPTAEMLRQERKIKAKNYAEGGETDPPYRPLGIPMEGYEPDSVFYETPTRYSEPKQEAKPKPVNKKEDKPKPTSKRSEVQDYYLNQYLNQNSSTPKPDRYIAERDASSTKLSPAMSTKEWQEGPRDFNIVKGIQVALDLGQMAPNPFIAGGSYLASLPFTTYDVLDDLSKDDYKQAAVDALGYIPKLKNVGSLNTVIDATSLYNDASKKADGGLVNTLEGDLISKVIMNRNRDKDFVQRAYAVGEYPESNMFVQPDVNEFGQKNSHLMGWGEDESGQAYMYPEVMNPNNEAIKVPNQYADYISSTGYKKATGIPYAHGGPLGGDDDTFKSKLNQGATVGKTSQDWLANWVQDPEFANRLNRNFPSSAGDLEKKIYGVKEARERASAANLKNINKVIPDIVNDIYDTQFLYNTNPEINTGLLSSYKSRLEDPKSIKALEKNLSTNPQGFTDEQGRIIITNEANTQYGPQSVGVHELIHKVSERDKTLDKLFRGKFQTPSQDRIDANYDKDEMYPFLMQMRFDNKFQPGEEITPERLKQIRDSGYRNHLFRYYNDDEISKYLNTLASNQTQAPIQYAAQGGKLYAEGGDGEDPVTLYKKAQYDPNTGKILEYAGSQGNEYYVTPNTPQGIDFQRTLPELEIIDEYNSSKDPYGNKMNIASEKGAIRNPNYQPLASGKLDIDPAGQLLLAGAVANPSNLLGELASEVTMVDPTSLVKNVGNKILKTTKDIKSAADEFVVTPIQFRKEIAELKKLKNDYSNIFNTDEGKKRLGLLGIDPSKISDYDLTFKPNIGSAYSTGFDDFINKMNIDFREIQKLKKKGYIVSPKSIFEHEMGHLLQKESYKQKGIFKDIDKYNQDLIEYNKIEDRILNNPYMTNVDKSLKLRLHRLKKPIKPFITTKPTLIDEGAKQLTRNNSVIDDKKIAAAVSQGKDVLSFPEKSYSYFNYGTDVERFAHLREMRQNMIESGVIKNMYDPITSEHLAKFIANNPGDRVSSFVDTSPNNIEWLKTLLNNMPAAVPVIGVGAGAIQSSQPEQQSYGGPINPYMYYSGGPMYYDVGGKVWKNIAAGLYGAGEGILDTVTMGATDQLTDKGFEYLTKVGNKNLDLNDPDDVKFLKTQQQIKGYSNAAGAIGTAVVTGNVQGAIGQGTKGLNTAFQASDWASDDFKKWSQGISGVAGLAAGFAGGLNSDSFNAAAKAGTGIAGFGQKAGKIGSFGNQVTGMFGSNQQPLWQQGEQRQELLNSPEYLAMKERENQAYVNQGLSFASTGGNIINSLNLQNSMRGKYNNYKRRYSKGGTFQKFGINEIPDSAGYHHENAYGGVPIGPNAMAEGGEFVLDNNYVVSDEVDGMNTQTDEFGRTMAQNLKRDLSKYTMRDLNSKNRDSLRRPMDPLAEQTINQIKQKAMMETEIARAEAQAKEQERQAMVEGALQYAAAGGKLNDDITKIVKEEYAAAYGGYINPKKYKGLNMPYSSGGKLPKEVLRARVEAHMSPEEADAYVENYAKGGSIHIKESKKGTFTAAAKKHGKSVQEFARQVLANKGNYSSAMVKKANFARNAAKWHHAEGGNIRPDNPGFNALPEYVQAKIMNNMAHGGPVVSNVPQDFDLYAQNRGGMMMANGGNMYAVGGPGKRIIGIDEYGNPIYQNITTMSTQPTQFDVNYGDNYFLNRQSSIPMENYDANVTKPSTPVKGKINSQPGISYTQPEKTIDDFYQESQISQKVSEPIDFTSPLGTFEGVDASGNPVSINPALKETYNQGWRPEGTSIPKVNQSNQPNQGLTGLDYASGILNLAAPLSQIYYGAKGPDPVNYERVTGQKIDPTVAIALAAEEGRRAQDSAAYLMRQNAPTSGSYMNNLRNLSLQSGKQRGALAGGLRYQADLTNTQMQNELNKVNAGISMQEQIDRLQEKDAARTNVTEGLSGIGSSTANMIRDYRTNQLNQMIAKNIGTNNYKYDPINQTITYQDQNGKVVTVPAQTVIPPNVAVNVGTGQIQQPGTPQLKGFEERLNESFRNRFMGSNAGK